MWFLQSPKLKRETCSRILFSRQALFLMLHQWIPLSLLHAVCLFSNHISRPRHRSLNLYVIHTLALQLREVLIGSHRGLLRYSVPLPLSDSSLAGRVIHASTRSLPEPPRSGGVFGSRSLVPLWRSAAA